MRSLSVRLLPSLLVLLFAPVALAHNITLSGTQSFSSLDGSSADHDGLSNGVFTVSDGNLTVNGTVNCNDGFGVPASACPMAFSVSGNMTVNAGAALYAENRIGNGSGGSITLNVGGALVLSAKAGSTPGAIVSAASIVGTVGDGGNVTATAGTALTMGNAATIDAGSWLANAGTITLSAGTAITIDGNVLSGPSRNFTGTLTGSILAGAALTQKGGAITISTSSFAEPALIVGSNAAIVSQGESPGSGPVRLNGCGIEIRGLVAALGRFSTSTSVAIRSGKNLLVDARDLGVAGATLGRNARLRADTMLMGTGTNRFVDLFARGSVTVLGPAAAASTRYAISSNGGAVDPVTRGGNVRVIALEGTVTASGRVAEANQEFIGGQGGRVEVSAAGTVDLTTAAIRAVGNFAVPSPGRKGGEIAVRSHSGNVVWVNGTGDVRPIGSTSGIPPADQGKIFLTACGTVNTTGTSFPANGVPTGVFPTIATGVCSPASPSLPVGTLPLVTCNTPPVANDTAASTNEDTTVTVNLSGSDADGNPLTFTIVSGPLHGSLGAVISTGPTTSTVNYTPSLNYNGSDSFVFRANDGNGGTDDATASITITAVNDPPTFLAGPTVNVFEDSGPQTIANWVSSISPGPADESAQTVTFNVTNNNNAIFSVQPAVAPNGTLTFTPAPNQLGSATITIVAQDNGGTANGGDDTSNAQTSTINVNGVNDEPSFSAGPSQTVNEDAGPQTVSAWATAISAGPNEGSQTLTFVTSNNNNALFSAQPAVAPNGTLTYTPAANANGSATVTVFLQDNGGTANGGDDTSPSQTFTITVNAVNDEPSFTSGGNVTVLEDSGAYSASWATGISAGPADESGQTVTFTTSNDNNAIFSVQPSVAANGTLTFTPAANAYGIATVTIFAQDNGGTANGGDDTSPSQTFTINVTPVNDEPSFTAGGNVTVNEDSGAFSASWATSISAGPNESSQNVTFNVSNDNNALFSVQPSISPSGVLSFTPAANANGTATVTVFLMDDGGTANGGDDTSPSQTLTITINAVNDAPSFTSGGNVSVNEDSGAYSAAWATGISAGPADESGQTLTFNVSNDNNALFSVQPAVSPSGVLTFMVAANTFGSATVTVTLSDSGGLANGGVDTSAPQTFAITVNTVNDEPSFTSGGNVSVNEDSGAYSAAWATAISAGPNESGQTLTFVVSNDNNALFASQPSVSPSGALTFTPAANASGSATVSVFLMDDGGTANGGDDTSSTVTFTITVNSVNDAPSFTPGGNVSVLEDSGSYSATWATAISAGPANESGQTVNFIASNDNNALFSVQPSIAPDGTLTFAVATDAFGSATVTVFLMDDGGTANGGVNTSPTVTFTITVNSVNDAPSFTPGGNVSVNEDSGAYVAVWATSIAVGPANESGQTVAFNVSNNNNSLFSVQPSVSPTGVLSFTPAMNAFGSATVSVSLSDNGGIANGGVDTSPVTTFTITVNGINDPPAAGNDSFATFGNTEVRVDLSPSGTPHVLLTTPSGTGVLHNDIDAVEGDPFAITGVVGCADIAAPFDCTFGDGSVLSLNANGTFTFTPGPGATSASFQYVVTDSPSAGTPASATGSVTIPITEMIWYVNGSAAAGGNGTSIAPFNSFASLDGPGGSGDVDAPGHTIFVHNSIVNDNIGLEANQRLLGEGVGLTVSAVTLVPAGTRPTLNGGAATTVSVSFVTGVEIAGLTINSAGANAIAVTSAAFGTSAGANIHDNVISGAGTEGIAVNGGSGSGTTVLINNTPITSTGNGLGVTSVGPTQVAYTNGTVLSTTGRGISMSASLPGNLTITGLSNVTIDGNTAGDGINISQGTFDAVPGGAFNVVNGGTISVGTAGNSVGGAAVTLTNVSGNLALASFNAFGSTTGVTIAGTGLFTGAAGMQVTSTSGAVIAAAGVGVSVTNSTIGAANLSFTSISSSGAASGVVLNNTGVSGGLKVLGTGAPASGGTIQNASGHGVSLTSTFSPAFNNVSVQNTGGSGIKGSQVVDFAFTNGAIHNSGTAGNPDDSNIAFNTVATGTENNVSGVVTITGNSLTNGLWHGIDVINFSGTLANVVASNNIITSATTAALSKGTGIRVQILGSATTVSHLTRGSFAGNTITNFPSGGGIQVQGGNTALAGAPGTVGVAGSAVDKISITGNLIRGQSPVNRMNTNAILATVGGRGQGNFDISGNGTVANPLTNVTGTVIGVGANGNTTVTAVTSNNVIVANNGLASNGIGGGTGVTFGNTDTPNLDWTMSGNSISATVGNGILAVARGATGLLKLRILSNSVAAPTGGVREGIRVDAGNGASINDTVCLDITGNTSAGSGGATGIGLRKQGISATINAFGISGLSPSPTGTPNVENHVNALNPAGNGTTLLSATSGFTACTP